MSYRADLEAFLTQIASNPPDGNRLLVLVDWFTDNIRPGPLLDKPTPRHFTRWWHEAGLSKRYRHARESRTGMWSGSEIEYFLRNRLRNEKYFAADRRCIPFDHFGTAEIEGYEVFVSEPYNYGTQQEAQAVEECLATREALGCPVTFAREAAHEPSCYRFIIWHMFPITSAD